MNPMRVWAIATNVFREVFRDRVLYIAGLFAIGLVLAVIFLNEISGGTEAKISLDVGIAGIDLLGLTVAAFEGAGLINKEIDKRTALVLIAKPISRSEFVVGKHLGLTAVLWVLLAIMTVIFLGVMSWRQIDYPLGSVLLAIVFMGLELSVITAVSISFGVFTSSLMATVLTFAVYLMGHFSKNLLVLSESIETKSVKTIAQSIYLVFPDLSRLDLKNQAIYGLSIEPGTLAINAGYGLVYIGLLLAIATIIFSYREF
jgi:ABC-type transport system involved in multi-copper enzyme maturation permease subunit